MAPQQGFQHASDSPQTQTGWNRELENGPHKFKVGIEALIAEAVKEGEESTRRERLEFLLRLYEQSTWDDRVLTTIELYGKTTWQGILADPRCSVLFSSYRNTSFLVNGVAEVVPPGQPVYRYVVALHDLFHIPRGPRREFPAVYRIWACEVWDKTPGPRAGTRLA